MISLAKFLVVRTETSAGSFVNSISMSDRFIYQTTSAVPPGRGSMRERRSDTRTRKRHAGGMACRWLMTLALLEALLEKFVDVRDRAHICGFPRGRGS